MLITAEEVKRILDIYSIPIKGVLHVGAHECEELASYVQVWKVDPENMIWVDANEKLQQQLTSQGVKNYYYAALDEIGREATFHVTNNGQSSSLLPLGTHATSYPHIVVTERRTVKTETLSSFFERIEKNPSNYNVWNFDIQGSELHVLRGSEELLKYADAIYTEINVAEVYQGCGILQELDVFLYEHGFERTETRFVPESWGDALYVRTENTIT